MSMVDQYLDRLFDRLSGTGAAGRRALAEAEDHLRLAAADGEAAGMATEQAEAEAVRRFGSPDRIVRAARRAGRGLWAFAAALSGAWLFAGLAVAMFGFAFAARVVDIVVLGWMHPDATPACGSSSVLAGPTVCSETLPQLHLFLREGAAALAVAALILGVRTLLIRRGSLAAATGYSISAIAVALLVLAVGPLLAPTGMIDDTAPGLPFGSVTFLTGVAVTTALVIAHRTRAGRSHAKRAANNAPASP